MIKKEKIKKFLTNKIFIISFVTILLIIIGLVVYFGFKSGKDSVVIALSADIKGFDPCDTHNTQSHINDTYFNMVHDKLFIQDPNNKQNLKPQLLKEIPTKTGKILNCELKDNIFFHNDEKMTTEDVIFTINRGKHKGHDQFKEIENIEKIDDLKFKITLKEDVAYWDFPFIQMIRIINQKATEKNELEGVKIGAGAYKLKKYNPNKDLQLEIFEKYHDKNIIKNSPKKIKFKISKDDNALLQELERKQIDAILSYSNTQIKDLKKDLNKNKYKNIKILEHETASQDYIYFNKQKTNTKVREIISKSLDIQKIIDELELPNKVAKTFLHDKLIGYNPDINYHKHDIISAKKEFEKLDTEDKKLTIGHSTKIPQIITEKIIEQLRYVGFEVTLEVPEFNKLLDESAKVKDSKYNFIVLGENFEMKYGHKGIEDYFKTTDNKYNFCGIDEHDKKDIEDKLEKAKKSTELTKYESLLQEIETYLYEKSYLFPLISRNSFVLVNKEIEKGFEQDEFSRFVNMRSIEYKKNNNN